MVILLIILIMKLIRTMVWGVGWGWGQLMQVFAMVGTPRDPKLMRRMACAAHFSGWPVYLGKLEETVQTGFCLPFLLSALSLYPLPASIPPSQAPLSLSHSLYLVYASPSLRPLPSLALIRSFYLTLSLALDFCLRPSVRQFVPRSCLCEILSPTSTPHGFSVSSYPHSLPLPFFLQNLHPDQERV